MPVLSLSRETRDKDNGRFSLHDISAIMRRFSMPEHPAVGAGDMQIINCPMFQFLCAIHVQYSRFNIHGSRFFIHASASLAAFRYAQKSHSGADRAKSRS